MFIWKRNHDPLDLAHAPGSLSGTAGLECCFLADTSGKKFTHAGAAVLPLLPDKTAKSTAYPVFQHE